MTGEIEEKTRQVQLEFARALEDRLAIAVAAGKDLAVSPFESSGPDEADTLTLAQRYELLDADDEAPEGWTRYRTSLVRL